MRVANNSPRLRARRLLPRGQAGRLDALTEGELDMDGAASSGLEEINRPFDPVAELEEKGRSAGEQTRLLRRLVALYANHDLMPSSGVFPTRIAWPLWDACSNGDRCWSGCEGRQTTNHWLYGISLPWIGPHYAESRVAMVGLNQRDGGGPLIQWNVVEEAVKQLKAGRARPHGSAFWKGASRYVALWLGRGRPAARVQVHAALQHAALLQLTKCSLTGGRGSPEPTMLELCPAKYLRGELEVLAPEVVLICTRQHGAEVSRALQCPPFRPQGTESLDATVASIAGRDVPIIQLRHPAGKPNADGKSAVERSLEALTRYLGQSTAIT